MRNQISLSGILIGIYFFSSPVSRAEIRPENIHSVGAKKMQNYIQDGLFVGGDGKLTEFAVNDIRWANNGGYERVVIDMNSDRSPYYHISISPKENRLTISLSGKANLKFDPTKIKKAFKRSSMIQNIMLLPPLDGVPWTVVLELKSGVPVEVFELDQPASTRLIMDLQRKKSRAPVKG